MTTGPCFVGVEVSKDLLEVAVRPKGERWSASNNNVGLDSLVVRLEAMWPKMCSRTWGEAVGRGSSQQ